MNLKPLFQRIVVKRKTVEKIGNLFVPTLSDQLVKADVGEVIAVGDECTTVLPGDCVIFGKYAFKVMDLKDLLIKSGIKVDLDIDKDDELLVLNEEDVICKLENQTDTMFDEKSWDSLTKVQKYE